MGDQVADLPLSAPGGLALSEELLLRLRDEVGPAAQEAVEAIIAAIPGYADLRGDPGVRVGQAVQLALDHFLTLAAGSDDASTPVAKSTSGAYDLGRGEARSGRSMDALLAAYRIGARVSWRRLSRTAAEGGMSAESIGAFAELVFAYIDELTAASVTGHADELASSGRARERHLATLTRRLAGGADARAVDEAARRAQWSPPTTLTCLLLTEGQGAAVRTRLDPRTLSVSGDLPDLDDAWTLLLVPDLSAGGRARLVRDLSGRGAVVSSTLPWEKAAESVRRARALLRLPRRRLDTLDADDRLVDLVLAADPEVRDDLASRLLAPLADVRPSQREALVDTLRSWLLHQGRRADVAADLHVHPQTVRYRMGQIRDRFGDALDDPAVVLALVVALGRAPTPAERRDPSDESGRSRPGSRAGPPWGRLPPLGGGGTSVPLDADCDGVRGRISARHRRVDRSTGPGFHENCTANGEPGDSAGL